MDARTILTGLGVAVTGFVLTAVAVIELVRVDPVAGILGVLAGAVAALALLAGVLMRGDALTGPAELGLDGAAGFGWTLLVVMVLNYVHVLEVDGATPAVLAALVGGLLAVLASWTRRRREGRATSGS